MAKFKVGDRARCAELNDTGFHVPEGIGVVTEYDADDNTYVVRRDEKYPNDLLDELQDEWLYYPSELSPISTARTTIIEWYAPGENLPYDGAKVLWVCAGQFCGGEYRGDDFYTVDDWYNSPDQVDLWAYAPEVM